MTAVIDVLLALGLVALAFEIAAGRSLFRSLVMFVAFGLVMALAWARLSAPDLALAEAALGAGISGALLLVSYRRLGDARPRALPRLRSWLAAPVAALAAALVAVIAVASLDMPAPAATAGQAALQAMPQQPVANPVTGVLLLFRGYDTLLEAAVLLAAWLGAQLVRGNAPVAPAASARQPLVGALLCVVVPMAVLVAGHLLHAGGDAPGGAFQAGAVLAAAGVLLVLTGRVVPRAEPTAWQAAVLVAGVAVFSALGLATQWAGGDLLALPGLWAVYVVETALLGSIALALALLFAAGGGLAREQLP